MSETITDFSRAELENLFIKAFLERFHGCSYEEVVKSELSAYKTEDFMSSLSESDILQMFDPITLGPLMAALGTLRTEILISRGVMVRFYTDDLGGFYWKLIREDKTECDETDQTEETLIALTNILR